MQLQNQNQEINRMDKWKKHIYDESNWLHYTLEGDCDIPDFKLPEENRFIGCYGRLHRDYLKEGYLARYNSLVLTGKLWTYIIDFNEQVEEGLAHIIEQMKIAECVTKELKTSIVAWVYTFNVVFT